MIDLSMVRYGSPLPLPQLIPLRAGPLSLMLEDGDLRYIRLGDHEIVRRIYVAVRDHNWGTISPDYTHISVDSRSDSFSIRYDVSNRDPALGIDFTWHGEISGDPHGTIVFHMIGQAQSTFRSNRVGFCVLHPIRECTGAACIIETTDGRQEYSHFPTAIAPQQPFIDMRAIRHEVMPGLWAEVRFAGDVFEMEDQRAWIDASFKTYCTPLNLPFPREIREGAVVEQSVTLSLHGDLLDHRFESPDVKPITLRRTDHSSVPLPRIGLGSASHGQPLTAHESDRLRAMNLSHLRVDLYLSDENFTARLCQAASESNQVGIPLEVALFLSENAKSELQTLRAALDTIMPQIFVWLIFPVGLKSTTEPLIRVARHYLTDYAPAALFGGGTNVYFTELNRDRPALEMLALLDFVSYSANPQVHAFDNRSLSETCEALPHTLASARNFIGNKLIAISPLTLKPRFNAVATEPEADVPTNELPRQVDPRQMSLFGAAWTLCSFKYIAESGLVQHVTYYETTGWRGVMETAHGSVLPNKFASTPSGVFPLYHVLADLGEMAGSLVYPIESDAPLAVDGLLIEKEGKLHLLIANWTAQSLAVQITFATIAAIRILDETTVESATLSPREFRISPSEAQGTTIQLPPFAFARLDLHTS